MSVADALQQIRRSLSESENLIVAAHRVDSSGAALFDETERRQISQAAFLNLFVAWEEFLESTIVSFMLGSSTLSGNTPRRFVSPPTEAAARGILVGPMKYFDFGNHEKVKLIVQLYFANGFPFNPHFSAVLSDLSDLRTIRNSCAHITSTTQKALEALALRLFGAPWPGIKAYDLLLSVDPANSPSTVYASYKTKLLAAAVQIANG